MSPLFSRHLPNSSLHFRCKAASFMCHSSRNMKTYFKVKCTCLIYPVMHCLSCARGCCPTLPHSQNGDSLTPSHILLQRAEEESLRSHAVVTQPGSAEVWRRGEFKSHTHTHTRCLQSTSRPTLTPHLVPLSSHCLVWLCSAS